MEVVSNLSIAMLLGAGGVHGGGSYSLKCCIAGVHRGVPCLLSHCDVGYWRCTLKWSTLANSVVLGTGGVHEGGVLAGVYGSGLPSQTLWCWVLAVYMEVE